MTRASQRPAAEPLSDHPGRGRLTTLLPRRPLPWLLVAGYVAQVAVRLLLSRNQLAPHIYEDEAALMVTARWLTGGPGADFTDVTFHPGGYPLLLTPAYLLAHDLVSVYRIVMVINAVAGAFAFPLAYLLLRRFDVRRATAGFVAWGAALLPAATLYGETALADAIMPVLVLCWLLALDRFLRTGHPLAGVLASVAAGYAYLTHIRGLILIGVHVLILLVYLVRDPRRRATYLALLAAAACFVAAWLFNGRLTATLYPGGPDDLSGILLGRLRSVDGQLWAISCGAGQIWAMIIGTWGLGGIGLLATVHRICARRTRLAERTVAIGLVVLTLAIAYASSAAFPDWHRAGNFAYGRYLSCLAPVYCLFGIVALLKARRRVPLFLASGALVGVTAVWVRLYAGDRLHTYSFQRFDFPEVSMLGKWTHLDLGKTSVTACAIMAFLVLAMRIGPRVFASGLLAMNIVAMLILTVSVSSPGSPPVAQFPGRPHSGVAVDSRVSTLVSSAIALRVDWTRTRWFTPGRDRPGPGVCSAAVRWRPGIRPDTTWPAHPAGWRPRLVTVNTIGWVMWSAPRCAG